MEPAAPMRVVSRGTYQDARPCLEVRLDTLEQTMQPLFESARWLSGMGDK